MIKFYPALTGDLPCRVVMALGVFDAVHLGHLEIVRATVELAKKLAAKPVAVTFFPHPRQVVAQEAPPLLLPPNIRLQKLLEAGMSSVGTIDFTASLAEMAPEKFLDKIIGEKDIEIAGIVVGEHWRFGKGGAGNKLLLENYLKAKNIAFIPVPEKLYRDQIISASRIRQLTAQGDLDEARAMLGHAVPIFGKIVHGHRDAGTLLAAPTANLELASEVQLPDGVYAGRAILENGESYPAAVNIGFSPTFKRGEHRVEVHLLNYSGNLYGATLRIDLLAKIRDERTFASADALKRQIAVDLDRIAALFSRDEK